MRRIVMFNRVSADGYFASADGKLDWMVPDPEVDKLGAAATASFDTVLFGRRTYEMFASFWPHALDDAQPLRDPHTSAPIPRSPEMRAMGVMLNEATKLVFSKTLKEATWKNSRIHRALDPREIEAWKQQPGKDLIIFGSGSVVAQLTQHGLIDEYELIVAPTLLGKGRTLLGDVAHPTRLELLEARAFGSGSVVLRYARKK